MFVHSKTTASATIGLFNCNSPTIASYFASPVQPKHDSSWMRRSKYLQLLISFCPCFFIHRALVGFLIRATKSNNFAAFAVLLLHVDIFAHLSRRICYECRVRQIDIADYTKRCRLELVLFCSCTDGWRTLRGTTVTFADEEQFTCSTYSNGFKRWYMMLVKIDSSKGVWIIE